MSINTHLFFSFPVISIKNVWKIRLPPLLNTLITSLVLLLIKLSQWPETLMSESKMNIPESEWIHWKRSSAFSINNTIIPSLSFSSICPFQTFFIQANSSPSICSLLKLPSAVRTSIETHRDFKRPQLGREILYGIFNSWVEILVYLFDSSFYYIKRLRGSQEIWNICQIFIVWLGDLNLLAIRVRGAISLCFFI